MESPHVETVVDKAVNFVKDVLGIHHEAAPEVEGNPEYPDTAPEVTAEKAMRLDPDTFVVSPSGQVTPGTNTSVRAETEAERLRREVGEYPREKTALELNAESARAEEGG
jgi:hypothetical protein